MVPRDGRNLIPWLSEVCRRVSLHETPERYMTGKIPGEMLYIGGGHWRAIMVGPEGNEEPDEITGIRLVNPDRNKIEQYLVEQGVCILMGLQWENP